MYHAKNLHNLVTFLLR